MQLLFTIAPTEFAQWIADSALTDRGPVPRVPLPHAEREDYEQILPLLSVLRALCVSNLCLFNESFLYCSSSASCSISSACTSGGTPAAAVGRGQRMTGGWAMSGFFRRIVFKSS